MVNIFATIENEIRLQCNMALDALECCSENLINYQTISKKLQNIELAKFADSISVINKKQQRSSFLFRESSKCVDKFIRNIHSFIICHANISKIKEWKGSNNRYPFNGDKDAIINQIQGLFLSLSSFSVENVRELRNHLEHYEERLFYFSSTQDTFSPFSMCNISEEDNLISMRMFLYEDNRNSKNFLGAKKIYKFREQTYNILDMEKDIVTLKEKIVLNDLFHNSGLSIMY